MPAPSGIFTGGSMPGRVSTANALGAGIERGVMPPGLAIDGMPATLAPASAIRGMLGILEIAVGALVADGAMPTNVFWLGGPSGNGGPIIGIGAGGVTPGGTGIGGGARPCDGHRRARQILHRRRRVERRHTAAARELAGRQLRPSNESLLVGQSLLAERRHRRGATGGLARRPAWKLSATCRTARLR